MSEYNIRFANENDIPQIMKFIDEYWKKDHILSKNTELFVWQYCNNNRLNMVIGVDENNTIQGILGYIPYSDNQDKDYSLALWKAKEGTSFLGVKLLRYLLKEELHKNVFCNGINLKTTESIYRRSGFSVNKLKQWYRLSEKEKYNIAVVKNKVIPQFLVQANLNLIKIDDFSELKAYAGESLFDKNLVPYKSEEYVCKRYFNHPVYEYIICGVRNCEDKINAAIVFRIQECNEAKALRIIDCIGDYNLIYEITDKIIDMANEYDAEYIDMYEAGLEDSKLIKAGWLMVGQDDNIIPNYFSPYAQCNVDINYCTMDERIVLFKGDGDQDRPN